MSNKMTHVMACLGSIFICLVGMGIAAPPAGAQLADSMMVGDDTMDLVDTLAIDTAPPPLPVYEQPPVLRPGYIWTPGYWAWGPAGYFWIPGAWMLPPAPGLLWTPGYWGATGIGFIWHPGYWGARVGFYGGINYGFGYFGTGYVGGRWSGGHFFYNTVVTNVDGRFVRTVYVNRDFVGNTSHVSYTGGPGGVIARPVAWPVGERRWTMTAGQVQREQRAAQNRNQLAGTIRPNTVRQSAGRGRPPFDPLRPEDRAAARPHVRRVPHSGRPFHGRPSGRGGR